MYNKDAKIIITSITPYFSMLGVIYTLFSGSLDDTARDDRRKYETSR